MSMARCQRCDRPIAVRWRICPWCKRWSGQPHMRDSERLDLELHGLVSVSFTLGCVLLVWALLTPTDAKALWWVLVGASTLLVSSAVGALVSRRAYDVMVAAWGALLAVSAWAVIKTEGGVVLVVPTIVLVVSLVRRRVLRARLGGEPSLIGYVARQGVDTSRCEFCGASATGVYAPRIVVSAVVISVMTHTGFRVVCARHARLRAILPTVVTMLFGWWGLGWAVLDAGCAPRQLESRWR